MLKHVLQLAPTYSLLLYFLVSPLSMDPRISFSSDFVDVERANKYESSYREAPVSSDFEFSVKNYNMIPADEIFFKGMMVPLKDNSTDYRVRKMTLRDELLVDDEFEDESPRVTKSSGWWKERLGLKKCHNVTKKCERSNNGVLEKVVEEKSSSDFVHQEEGINSKRSQEVWIERGLT